MMFFRRHDDIKFRTAYKAVLRNLVISDVYPGSLLADFETLLQYIRETPQSLTASGQLSLKACADLLPKLKKPIEVFTDRPRHNAYPQLSGLYLLLFATGFAQITYKKKTAVLSLREEMMTQWEQLNPIERYGTLMESWFLRGSPEIIGEHDRRWGDLYNFESVINLLSSLQHQQPNRIYESLKYWPGYYNLALMEMFGWITIDGHEFKKSSGWQVKNLQVTDLGHACISLINQNVMTDIIWDDVVGSSPLRNIFCHYMLNWKKSIVLPTIKTREGLFTFKVSLGKIWRRITIGASNSMDALACEIVRSVKFDMDHLYCFYVPTLFRTKLQIAHPYMESEISTREITVGQVPITIEEDILFLYDFGDNWQFNLMLEKVDEGGNSDAPPTVIEIFGEAPSQYWDDDDGDFDLVDDSDED